MQKKPITVFGKEVKRRGDSYCLAPGLFIDSWDYPEWTPAKAEYEHTQVYRASIPGVLMPNRKSIRAAINDLERAILKDLAEAEKRVAELRKIVGKR